MKTFFIGDLALDEYFTPSHWPGLADKAIIRPAGRYVGGMIANAASVFAGLGGQAELLSQLPPGSLSVELCQTMEYRKVGTRFMLYDTQMPEPRNLIFLSDSEHVVLITDTGEAPMVLTDEVWRALQGPGFIYSTLTRLKRLTVEQQQGIGVVNHLKNTGRRFVLDLDVEPFCADDLPYLQGSEVLILNDLGFKASFPKSTDAEVCDWRTRNEISYLVHTRGPLGARIYHGGGVLEHPGFPVTPVDVTGAGDTFGGAFTFALSQLETVEAALNLAITASARAVTQKGPQGGVASRAEIEDFGASQKVVKWL